MPEMYTFKSKVRYSETDSSGRLSLTALLNYYQDCVTFHSADAGLPLEELFKDNMAWVLMSWHIEIARMPRLGECIEVCTNPYRIGGFTGLRNFWMTGEDGERLNIADSTWALLDTRTGRPTHVRPDFADAYGLGERVELGWRSKPVRIGADAEVLPGGIEVQSGMLDMNMHMNNAWYAHLAAERLPEGYAYSRLSIEYKQPAKLGDMPTVAREQDEDGVTIALMLADKPCALVRFAR